MASAAAIEATCGSPSSSISDQSVQPKNRYACQNVFAGYKSWRADTQGVGHDWVDFIGSATHQQQRQKTIKDTKKNTRQNSHKKLRAVPINKKYPASVIQTPYRFPFASAHQQSDTDTGTVPPIVSWPPVIHFCICQGCWCHSALVPINGFIRTKNKYGSKTYATQLEIE